MTDAPHLLRLPPELVLRVSSHLTTEQLGAFRLTCKYVETSLFDSFAREFFTKRQFMVEEVSLEALVDIANHKTLSPYLSDVIIGLDQLRDVDDWAFVRSTERPQAVSRSTLLATGRAREMLVDAFTRLPNLRTVGLRDYAGLGRRREGEHARWQSYGWSFGLSDAQRQEVRDGRWNGPTEVMSESSRTVFPLVLYALGLSASKPANIEVFLRRYRLPPVSLDVLKSFLQPAISPVLFGLTRLMLNLDHLEPSNSHSYKIGSCDHLRRLLEHAKNLQHLRLNFTGETHYPVSFLDWLGHPTADSTNLSDANVLACLTTLELGMLAAPYEALVHLASRFSLKCFTLWKVAIKCQDAKEAHGEPNPWTAFLQALSKSLPSPKGVKTMTIGYPSLTPNMVYREKLHIPIGFLSEGGTAKDAESNSEELEFKVTYHQHFGSDVRPWLDDIALRVRHKPEQDMSLEDGFEDGDSSEDTVDSSEEEDSMTAEEGDDLMPAEQDDHVDAFYGSLRTRHRDLRTQ